MKNKKLLDEFHSLGEKVGVKIIKGKGDFSGGICTLNEQKVIVINKTKPIEQRLSILANSFIEYDLDKFYVVPALRAFINKSTTLNFK